MANKTIQDQQTVPMLQIENRLQFLKSNLSKVITKFILHTILQQSKPVFEGLHLCRFPSLLCLCNVNYHQQQGTTLFWKVKQDFKYVQYDMCTEMGLPILKSHPKDLYRLSLNLWACSRRSLKRGNRTSAPAHHPKATRLNISIFSTPWLLWFTSFAHSFWFLVVLYLTSFLKACICAGVGSVTLSFLTATGPCQ